MRNRREVLRFVNTPARLEQLSTLLGQAMGRRVRVEVSAPAPGGESPGGEWADPDANDASADAGKGGAQRRAAMELPLVRDLLDAFPDAKLVDARDDGDAAELGGPEDADPSEDDDA